MANSNEILEIIDDIFSNENNNRAYGITSLISVNDLLNYAQNYSGSQERRGKLADECSARNYKFSDKELIDIVKKYYDLFDYKKIILMAGGIVNKHFENSEYRDNPDALLELGYLRDYINKLAKKYINPNEKVQIFDANLRKGTLSVVFKRLLGDDTEVRFRPSFYPFTEPSVEVDITCSSCHGKGCPVCKNNGMVTVLGAGVVHPNVLKMSGYDSKEWSGFAFGFGAERLAMMKYDIDDIRVFYNVDLRESKVFDREDEE